MLCDCCCTVAVRTRSRHTTHTRIHHDQTCKAMVRTRVYRSTNCARSRKQQQQAEQNRQPKCGVPAHRPARTSSTRAHVLQHTQNRHRYNIVTAYAGRNMEHGLLHATHSSCWCCCCGSALLLVEAEVLLPQLLLCPRKAWG